MGSGVSLYATVARSGFRRYATYRVATAAGVFTNTIFGCILTYTFMALWDERPHLGGYDRTQAMTYVWTGQMLLATTAVFMTGFNQELQERIRNGDVAIDLYRPVDLQLWWLASDLGRAAFELVARGAVPMAFGALVFGAALPVSPVTWLLFLCAVTLAVVVSFALRYLIGLSAFWLLDSSGMTMIGTLVSLFCSGMLLPLAAFPGTLGDTLEWLPWASLIQAPAEVLLGRQEGWAALGVLARQAGWALVVLAVGRAMQTAATRKFVVQGG